MFTRKETKSRIFSTPNNFGVWLQYQRRPTTVESVTVNQDNGHLVVTFSQDVDFKVADIVEFIRQEEQQTIYLGAMLEKISEHFGIEMEAETWNEDLANMIEEIVELAQREYEDKRPC